MSRSGDTYKYICSESDILGSDANNLEQEYTHREKKYTATEFDGR